MSSVLLFNVLLLSELFMATFFSKQRWQRFVFFEYACASANYLESTVGLELALTTFGVKRPIHCATQAQ